MSFWLVPQEYQHYIGPRNFKLEDPATHTQQNIDTRILEAIAYFTHMKYASGDTRDRLWSDFRYLFHIWDQALFGNAHEQVREFLRDYLFQHTVLIHVTTKSGVPVRADVALAQAVSGPEEIPSWSQEAEAEWKEREAEAKAKEICTKEGE